MKHIKLFEEFKNELSEYYKPPAGANDKVLPGIVSDADTQKMKWSDIQKMKQINGSKSKAEISQGVSITSIPKGPSIICAAVLNTDGEASGTETVYEIPVFRAGNNLTFFEDTAMEHSMSIKDFQKMIDDYYDTPIKTRKGKIPGVGVSYTKTWNLYFFI